MNVTKFNTSIVLSANGNGRSTALIVVESILFVLVDVTAFVGNLLICLTLYRNPSLRTITNTFVFSLALTDLLTSILVIPLKIASAIEDPSVMGDLTCQITGITVYNLAGISLLTLTQIAVNRYVRVVRPGMYPKIYTRKSAAIMAFSVWVVTLVIGVLAFSVLGVTFTHSNPNPAICNIVYSNKTDVAFYTFVIVLYNVPTSILIVVCYTSVYRKIRQHNSGIRRSSVVRTTGSRFHGVEESTMTKLFAAVLVGFYLCWFPVFITNILNAFDAIAAEARVYSSFYHLLPAYASSMINPVIYATMSSKFRIEFLNILNRKYFSMNRGVREDSPETENGLKLSELIMASTRQSETNVRQ